MCKTPENKYKFSFGEMISSGVSGKTSATGTIGVILCFLSMLIIFGTVIFYFINVSEASNILDMMDRCIIMLGIGAALLGCRKVTGALVSQKGAPTQVIDALNESLEEQQPDDKQDKNTLV